MIKIMLNIPDYIEFMKYLEKEILEKPKTEEDRHDIEIYMNSIRKELPTKWTQYYDDFVEIKKREDDPQYQEYRRLKDKYEGDQNGI